MRLGAMGDWQAKSTAEKVVQILALWVFLIGAGVVLERCQSALGIGQ